MKNLFKSIFSLCLLLAAVTPITSCGDTSKTAKDNGNIKALDDLRSDSTLTIDRAQNQLKVHKVYYVDKTGSMTSSKNKVKMNGVDTTLFALVKQELKNAVTECKEPNTRIDIITFADKKEWQNHKHKETLVVQGTSQSQYDPILGFIDNIRTVEGRPTKNNQQNYHETDHGIVLEDFMKNRLLDGYINEMYILTDGEEDATNTNTADDFKDLIRHANDKPYRYGFVVGLNNPAQNSWIYNAFLNDGGDHFHAVRGCNLGINLFSFAVNDGISVDGIRKKPYIRVPYVGNAPDSLTLSTENKNIPFDINIRSIDRDSMYVTLEIRQKDSSIELKDNEKFEVYFKPIWGNNGNCLNFPKGNIPLMIKCTDQKERSVEIANINKLNSLNFKYYAPALFFKWDPEKHIIWEDIEVNYSSDAKKANAVTNIQFGTPQYLTVLDSDQNPVNQFQVLNDTILRVGFLLNPDKQIKEDADYTITINSPQKLESIVIDGQTFTPPAVITNSVTAYKAFNPWWILIIAIALSPLLIYIGVKLAQWIARLNKPKFPGGAITLQFKTPSNDISCHNFSFIKSGNRGAKLGIINSDKGSSLNINKLAHDCVDKVVLLNINSKRPNDTSNRWDGWSLYVSTDFKNARLRNKQIEKFEIKPLKKKHIQINIYSPTELIHSIILDANRINNPQIEVISDSNHTIKCDRKKRD